MEKKTVLLFVFDGFSDWEPSYAIAEINQSDRYKVKTFGISNKPVKSVGGLTVLPDLDIVSVAKEKPAMVILPGGTAWEQKKLHGIEAPVGQFTESDVPLAAICAATTVLANCGLLDYRKHTSNGLDYLKQNCPGYRGDMFYHEAASVTDQNIITANGTAATEFARDIFKALAIYDRSTADEWYTIFKNGIV